MYIDTHCHILKEEYSNIDELITECKLKNVNKIIISGCELNNIEESIEISNKYENIYLSLGYHPSEASKITNIDIENLKNKIIQNKKVVAIGEIGLDYYWSKDNKEEQKKLFNCMLNLAEELNLPVVIHSRDAFQDTYDILKKRNLKGVIHCFSGNLENAKMYISIGYKLGIGGVLTFKNSKLKDVIKFINLNHIITETDSPYLAPEPYRGKQNSPINIPIIVQEIAKQKNVDIKEVETKIENNVKELFQI